MANPKGGDAMSLLELCLKILEVFVKMVSITTGLLTLRNSWKKHVTRKTTGNRLAPDPVVFLL